MARVKRFKAPRVSTVIGQGAVITGDLAFSGGLHLDGAETHELCGKADSLPLDLRLQEPDATRSILEQHVRFLVQQP